MPLLYTVITGTFMTAMPWKMTPCMIHPVLKMADHYIIPGTAAN